MGRSTAGLIAALLLIGPASAGSLVAHDRSLLRGNVPVRLSLDSSGVCALDLRVDADDYALAEAWQGLALEHAQSGIAVSSEVGPTTALRLSAPEPEFAALMKAAGEVVARSESSGAWRGLGLVCRGPSKTWLAAADRAFGRRSKLRRVESKPARVFEPEALRIQTGPPALSLLWRTGELSMVEVQLAMELRRVSVVSALADEEIDAQVSVDIDFPITGGRAALRVLFPERQPIKPLLTLVKSSLAETEEAPLDDETLAERWLSQTSALARAVDPASGRARILADREDRNIDHERDLADAERRSADDFLDRCEPLAVASAAVVIQHPNPPNHGEFYEGPAKKKRNTMIEPSFDDEDE